MFHIGHFFIDVMLKTIFVCLAMMDATVSTPRSRLMWLLLAYQGTLTKRLSNYSDTAVLCRYCEILRTWQ
jgi:hypothetical protein